MSAQLYFSLIIIGVGLLVMFVLQLFGIEVPSLP